MRRGPRGRQLAVGVAAAGPEQLAGAERLKEERQRGTAHGGDYEQQVATVLEWIHAPFEDTVLDVGSELGAQRNRAGDHVVHLNPVIRGQFAGTGRARLAESWTFLRWYLDAGHMMSVVMERPVNETMLRVEYSHDLPAMTDVGPLRSWRVTITTPAFVHETAIGIASGSDEVSEALFATIIDKALLTVYPGSKDNDPFAGADVREWVDENNDALRALVAELRS